MDYVVVEDNGSHKVLVRCLICGEEKISTRYSIRNEIGMYHSGSSCRKYKSELIGNAINDYKVLSVGNHSKYAGIKLLTVECKICGREHVLRHANIESYTHKDCMRSVEYDRKFYSRWSNIVTRCKSSVFYEDIDNDYKYFIDFHDDWYDKYLEACNKFKNVSFDRIDNTKGYTKSNLRLTDMKTQQGNTRRNTIVYATSPDGREFKFSNRFQFGTRMGLNPRSMTNAIREGRKYMSWVFIDSGEYNNTIEGVETNCVYEKHESLWVKLP